MGGEIFKGVMDMLEAPRMSPDSAQTGSMVLGPVADDIHDIGKSVFRAVAESYGFTVIGGGTIDSTVAVYVGADAWTSDAFEGVHMCRRLLEQKPRTRQQPTRAARDR
jgi:methanogenic corrinoid protein MtbC1